METLLEDYKRRLETATKMLETISKSDIITLTRIETKVGCYRTIIAELEREFTSNRLQQ